MSEQKRKIGFTVACVNEFANRHRLSSKEAFQYLFQFKGIAFIKENYLNQYYGKKDSVIVYKDEKEFNGFTIYSVDRVK